MDRPKREAMSQPQQPDEIRNRSSTGEEVALLDRLLRVERSIAEKLKTALQPTRSARAWDIATKLAVPIILGVSAFVYRIDGRVAYIEATRFTAADFERRMQELDRRIVAAANGPDWLRTEMTALSVKLDLIKEQSNKLSERLVRMETIRDKEAK